MNGPYHRLIFGKSRIKAGDTRYFIVMKYFFSTAFIMMAHNEQQAAANQSN